MNSFAAMPAVAAVGAFFRELRFGTWNFLRGRKKPTDEWGKPILRDRNMDLIAMFHLLGPEHGTRIDDQTWRDLGMDEVFAKIDRTSSMPGRQVLYHQLRTLHGDDALLTEQARQYARFRFDAGLRGLLQPLLGRLDGKEAFLLAPLLLNPLPEKPKLAGLIYLSSFSALGAALGCFFSPVFLLPFIGLGVVNFLVNISYGRKVTPYLPGLVQLKVFLGACRDLTRIPEAGDLPQVVRISQALPLIGIVRDRLRWVIPGRADLGELPNAILDSLNLFFLFDVVSFLHTLPLLRRHQAELAGLMEELGSLDAALSVASYLEGLPGSTLPVLTDAREIKVQGLYHPLLAAPVGNALTLEGRSALITGSNMAGKTTFIRTVGINVILAQTLHICLADSAILPRAVVRSSIRREDRLEEGHSYYFVELQRLREFLGAEGTGALHLFLIDEIFRGTNTLERIAASTAVLQHLGRHHLALVTTHDLELNGLLEESFDMHHFSEQVLDDQCGFDYRIQPGPARSRNAIKLLELNGYPEAITRQAAAVANRLAGSFDG